MKKRKKKNPPVMKMEFDFQLRSNRKKIVKKKGKVIAYILVSNELLPVDRASRPVDVRGRKSRCMPLIKKKKEFIPIFDGW